MAVSIVFFSDTARNLYATFRQISANGTLVDFWNRALGVWSSSVALADRKVTITEGGVNDLGLYTGGAAGLGTYTGWILKQVHDQDDADRVVGVSMSWLLSGAESRPVITADLSTLPSDIWTELEAQGGVTSSNMRGTDNALLAASYTAPNNAGITNAEASAATAASQSTTAATQATAAAADAATTVSRLTAGRATNMDNLDATVSSRSSHSAADVQSELTSNPVPSSNMRGTDSAFLAASWVAPDNAGITAAAADALSAKTAAELVDGKLTATRAGYLDNLSGGAIATQASVSAITNSTRTKIVCAVEAQIPASGTDVYTIDFLLYDTDGNMENADSTPTFTAANQIDTDRSGNLSAVSAVATGHYRATYSVASAHAAERIVISVSATENSKVLVTTHVLNVVALAGGSGFTSADRSQLQAVFDKLPSRLYFTGTDVASGAIDAATITGDMGLFKADVSALALQATLTATPAAVQAELTSSPVPSSNMRGTDNAMLAASYTAPDNTGIGNALSQATTAATQATTAATQSTNGAADAATVAARLTAARAGYLDFLDVAVSSRSDFNEATDDVTIAAGHGLATAADQTLIKAKTDLLPSQPASVNDIPTAAQVATQTESTLATAHGSGQWDASSDATLANQTTLLSIIGGVVPTPPSAVHVSTQRTWVLGSSNENDRAPQIITMTAGAAGTLAMDFVGQLNPDTGVSSVDTVTDTSGNGLVPTNLLPSQDRRRAHFDVTGLTAGLRYDLKVTVTTSDGQTLTGRGILRAE